MSFQQQAAIEAAKFVVKVNDIILFPLIMLLMGVAFLVFVYGAAVYVFNAANETARAEGQKSMLWGIIGILVMISALAIITIAINTFGLRNTLDCARNPSAAGCGGAFQTPPPPPVP